MVSKIPFQSFKCFVQYVTGCIHVYSIVVCRKLQQERDKLAENKNKITADLERLLNQREVIVSHMQAIFLVNIFI